MDKPESSINNLFLLGAGFTKSVFPEAPLNKDLFYEIVQARPRTKLNLYSKKYGTEDIEVLLTRLDLEIAETKSDVLDQNRKYIEADIAEYFEQFRFKQEIITNSIWVKNFVNLFQPNDAIVSLNYDCFLEGLLDYYEVWSPSKGYGGIEVAGIGTSVEPQPNPKNILIYKIHGSENFQTCSLDPRKFEIDPYEISVAINEEIYPKSGANSILTVIEGQPYIIAPSFVKSFYPQIELMMTEVLQAAKKAENFVIIGCGLRLEDSFLWLIIAAFLSRKSDKPIIVVDPKAETLRDRIKNYWRGAKVCPFAKGIEEGIDELLGSIKGNA